MLSRGCDRHFWRRHGRRALSRRRQQRAVTQIQCSKSEALGPMHCGRAEPRCKRPGSSRIWLESPEPSGVDQLRLCDVYSVWCPAQPVLMHVQCWRVREGSLRAGLRLLRRLRALRFRFRSHFVSADHVSVPATCPTRLSCRTAGPLLCVSIVGDARIRCALERAARPFRGRFCSGLQRRRSYSPGSRVA